MTLHPYIWNVYVKGFVNVDSDVCTLIFDGGQKSANKLFDCGFKGVVDL